MATNVAASANGGSASSPSNYSGVYHAYDANDGNRLFAGSAWNNGGIYHSASLPATLTIDFGQSRDINEIDIFTPRDSFTDKSTVTLSDTFTAYGMVAYTVEYLAADGTTWVNLISVTGNNKVWKQHTFSTLRTSKIRITCTADGGSGYMRVMEVEAWLAPLAFTTAASLPPAVVGSAYTATIAALGGTGATTYSLTSDGGTGGSINSATGVFTMPAQGAAGTKTITVSAARGSETVSQSFTILVNELPSSKWTKAQVVPVKDLVAWNALDNAASGADGAEDFSGSGRKLTAASNAPALQTLAAINNQKAVYFDGTTANPLVSSGAVTIKHLFIVAAAEGATFSTFRGLFGGIAAGDVLVGNSGVSNFYNYAYGGYGYKKNDVAFAAASQSAPVSGQFGIIEITSTGGLALDGIQIGQQTTDTARKWKGWFAEALFYSAIKNDRERLAIYRYLAMKFYLWRQTATGLNIFPFPNSQRTPGQSYVNSLESTSISGTYKGRTKSGLIRSFDASFNFRRQEEWDAAEAFWFQNKNKCVLEDNSFYPARQFTGRITTGIARDPQMVNDSNYKFGFVTT